MDPAPGEQLLSWTLDELNATLASHLDPFKDGLANRTLVKYLQSARRGAVDAERVYTTIATDLRVTCGNDRLAHAASQALTSHVYRYVATACPTSRVSVPGSSFEPKYSFHGVDLFAFIDSIREVSDASHGARSFSRLLRENLRQFAKTGSMHHSHWLRYPDSVALIGERLHVPHANELCNCSFWKGEISDFHKYFWAN